MSNVNPEVFQQMLLKLRNAFLEDVPEKLDRLDQLLLLMEQSGVDRESFNEFYRITHSLKGSGGTHGLNIITTICHQLEDLLNITHGGEKFTPSLIGVSLGYVDLLRIAVEQIHTENMDFTQIEQRLLEMRNQLHQKQYTVMIVESSKLLPQIYQQALAELPVRAVVVVDGLTALRRVLTEPFDVLITAFEIPVLNGVALIGALKLSGAMNRNIKTILITSNQAVAAKKNRATDADYRLIKDDKIAQNLLNTTRMALPDAKA